MFIYTCNTLTYINIYKFGPLCNLPLPLLKITFSGLCLAILLSVTMKVGEDR